MTPEQAATIDPNEVAVIDGALVLWFDGIPWVRSDDEAKALPLEFGAMVLVGGNPFEAGRKQTPMPAFIRHNLVQRLH